MISDGDKVDVRTFTERQDKPFVLPERADAFSVFQPRLQGLVLEAIYNILKFQLSSTSPGLRRTLSQTQSIDMDYLKRVIAASEEAKSPASKAAATGGGSTSLTVNVPNVGRPSEENKETGAATTMD